MVYDLKVFDIFNTIIFPFFIIALVYNLKVEDIFKATWLWLRCGIRPNLISENKDRIIFLFPDNESTQNAVKDFLADAEGIKTYVNLYKILRSEMYVTKEKENGRDES